VKSLEEIAAKPTIYDVVIVGGGPSGSACAYWLAHAGWNVCLIEKKHFPREKTCGDGLTPRSVHQIAEMGLEGIVAANGHHYKGLRAFGFGASLEMNWPSTPRFRTTATRSRDSISMGSSRTTRRSTAQKC